MTITLRVATPEDAVRIQAIYAPNVRDSAISFETVVPSVDEIRRRIENTLTRLPWLVAVENGVVLGYAYASPHRERRAYQWSVDVAVYIAAMAQRRGIGHLLYGALFDVLRELGYVQALASITVPNDSSIGVHESLGFVGQGVFKNVGYKLGAWRDMGWWKLELQPPMDEPAAPRVFSLMNAARLQELLQTPTAT